jgi:hypothetical protein
MNVDVNRALKSRSVALRLVLDVRDTCGHPQATMIAIARKLVGLGSILLAF